MSKNVVITGAVILVLAVLGWYFTRPKQTITPTPESTTQTTTPNGSVAPAEATASSRTVSITASGFQSKDITVKAGDSVAFENTDKVNHTVNSDPHPIHSLFPFLNAGTIKPGDKKTIMFDKAGTYKYHDHLNPSLTGSVTVQ